MIPHTHVSTLLLRLKLIAVLKTHSVERRRKKKAFHNAHTISAVRRPLSLSPLSLLPRHCLSVSVGPTSAHRYYQNSCNVFSSKVLFFTLRYSFTGIGIITDSPNIDPALRLGRPSPLLLSPTDYSLARRKVIFKSRSGCMASLGRLSEEGRAAARRFLNMICRSREVGRFLVSQRCARGARRDHYIFAK